MSKTSGSDSDGELGGGSAPQRESADHRSDLAPGTQVGEYLLEGVLGRGGMGTVYAARHPVIGKRVAIKVLAAHMSGDPALVRRFVDEARAVNKIGHPNIIDIFAFGQLADGRHYFVMEFLEGETLASRLAGDPMTVDEARRLLGQVASALEAAHRERIVHRDLKPDNIWIARPKHGEPFIKILDFGIAKLLELTEGRHVTETGAVFGTPHFMAPEQCMGQNIDGRTDIYALGVIFYRVFGGKLPFEGKTFAEVLAQHLAVVPPSPASWRPLAPALEALIMACLEKDPARRPQTAAEVGRRLSEALAQAAQGEAMPGALMPTMTSMAQAGTKPGYLTSSAAAHAILQPERTPLQRLGRPLLVVAAVVIVGAVAAVVLAGRHQGAAPVARPEVQRPAVAPTPAPAPVPPAPAPAPPTAVAPPPPAAEPVVRPRPRPEPPAPSRAEKRGLVRDNPFK